MATKYICVTGIAAVLLILAVSVYTDEVENSDLDNLIANLKCLAKTCSYIDASPMTTDEVSCCGVDSLTGN
ncbi:hypothetical protein DPMN_040367 [Dreissena polymorpha]|uniref:Uncharacterized protein n=1 Tax=Dreissena polymorpha TaxID=45954 RepID=A0A9D4HV81_DREPO|nr:hypothetical protein DPMN_040367 [Dreissena polymorpha]